MENQERHPEQAAAPPDAAGHRGAATQPQDATEMTPQGRPHPPLAEDAPPEVPGTAERRRRLPPAFPLGSTVLLLLLAAAVLVLAAYLLGVFD